MDKKKRIVFEISWEVANKVGGIYTVIRTKAPYVKRLAQEYYFVGPYFRWKSNSEFVEEKMPESFKDVYLKLKEKKIFLHFGVWKDIGMKTILVDFLDLMSDKNQIKTQMWLDYGIDSLFAGYDFEEPLVFGYSVGIFLDEFSKSSKRKEIVGHFHEWLSAGGLLYLKKFNPAVASVFTTHATVLERSLASSKEKFHSFLNSDEEAVRRGVQAKHGLEKAAARNCDCFTTVSAKSALACEQVFGRKPDVLTINGLDLKNTRENFSRKYLEGRKRLNEIVKSIFFPYYVFDVEKSLFCFLSGRFEVYSKGIDVFVKALSNLNQKLKKSEGTRNIVAFILIPSDHDGCRIEILKNLENLRKGLDLERRQGLPEISTHYASDGYILNLLSSNGLNNREEDKVKVVFCPIYLDKNDGFLNVSYGDFIRGFDLGVFPSFYEPWGYTPAESSAFGVPSITTDSAGFGLYVKEKLKKKYNSGIFVLPREKTKDEEFVEILEKQIFSFLDMSEENMKKNRFSAIRFMKNLSWEKLVKNYEKAYEIALEKKNRRVF